jgi:hypothetical protein
MRQDPARAESSPSSRSRPRSGGADRPPAGGPAAATAPVAARAPWQRALRTLAQLAARGAGWLGHRLRLLTRLPSLAHEVEALGRRLDALERRLDAHDRTPPPAAPPPATNRSAPPERPAPATPAPAARPAADWPGAADRQRLEQLFRPSAAERTAWERLWQDPDGPCTLAERLLDFYDPARHGDVVDALDDWLQTVSGGDVALIRVRPGDRVGPDCRLVQREPVPRAGAKFQASREIRPGLRCAGSVRRQAEAAGWD